MACRECDHEPRIGDYIIGGIHHVYDSLFIFRRKIATSSWAKYQSVVELQRASSINGNLHTDSFRG